MANDTTTTIVADAKANYLKLERAWKAEHGGTNRGLRSDLAHQATSDGTKVEPMDVLSAMRKVMEAEDVNAIHFRPGSKAANFIAWLAHREPTEMPTRAARPSAAPAHGDDAWAAAADRIDAAAGEPAEDSPPKVRPVVAPPSGLELEVLRPFASAYGQVARVFNPEFVERTLIQSGFSPRVVALLSSLA